MPTSRLDGRAALLFAAGALALSPCRLPAQGGAGESYWGPIPPPADSVRARSENRSRPAWETALLIPYWVVGFPLRLVASGFGETVEFMDERNVLSSIGGVLRPRDGPFGVTAEVQAGGVSGFGGGVGIAHDALFGRRGDRLRLSVATSVHHDTRLRGGLRIAFGHNRIDVGAGYRRRARARYFGIGPETVSADLAYYRHEVLWGGIGIRHAFGGGVAVGADALATTVRTGDVDEEETPPLSERFAGRLPQGYGTASEGVALRVALSHEDAPETGRPDHGGLRRVGVELFRDVGDGTTIAAYHAELQQFFRLWYPYHVLALRGVLAWTDDLGGRPIPFTRLYTNDDPDLLRGFPDFRWRDRGLFLVSAEYRWPLWVYGRPRSAGLDLYALADVGQVFDRLDAIRGDRLTLSAGFGLRLLSAAGFAMRIEYGRSVEGGVWRLRGDQVFQFARGSLFDGRDPVPAR